MTNLQRRKIKLNLTTSLFLISAIGAGSCLANDIASSPPGTAKKPAEPYMSADYSGPVDREEPIRYAANGNPQAGYSMRGAAELSKASDAIKAGDSHAACVAFTRAQKFFEKSNDTQMSLQSADLAKQVCAS